MHQALYRTYRPKTFKDVIGQDHIVPLLEKAIAANKVSHAYLFCGGRGTGKTSVARILASTLKTDPADVYEIDAASNRGIDDIRVLRDGVRTMPYDSKYKVYIIDEVHMLTKEAFNALLKTLEEPPSHVIFVLATTDPEKVPDTVLSRCQVYTFKNPNETILKEVVIRVAKEEGYTIEGSAAHLIAVLGDGSYRDTFSVLEKALLVSEDKKIVRSEVEKVTGAPKESLIIDFLTAYVQVDEKKGREIIQTIRTNTVSTSLFFKEVLELARFALLVRVDGGRVKEFEKTFGSSYVDAVNALATNPKFTSKTLESLLVAYQNIKHNAFPEMWLETLF